MKRLPLDRPCSGHEKRWPVRAIRIGKIEGTGPEEAAAGRMRDRGESPSLPNTFATWRWMVCSPTTAVPWDSTLVLPFAGFVSAALQFPAVRTYPAANLPACVPGSVVPDQNQRLLATEETVQMLIASDAPPGEH